MAKQAELRTVDANQTVFLQGFGPSAFSLYPAMLLHYLDSILCSNNNFRGSWERVLLCPARLGQDQGEQQSDQGPVLIETVRSPNSVDHQSLYPDDRSSYPLTRSDA